MKDIFSIIQQLTGIGSDSFKNEERIVELCPIDHVLDYYTNPMKVFVDPRDNKKYVIKWNGDDSRIKEIEKINIIIKGYNSEALKNYNEFIHLLPTDGKVHSPSELGFSKPTISYNLIPLWAFICIPNRTREPNSRNMVYKESRRAIIDNEKLYRMLYFEIKDNNTFTERFNKMIFDHICEMVHEAVDLGQYNDKNIWYDPSVKFLNWFQSKGIDHNSIKPLIPSTKSSRGGRPKGFGVRTIKRYKKVFHHFELSKEKFPSKKKSELYELIATRDHDGQTYSRRTIKDIIEQKKYNLKPSR